MLMNTRTDKFHVFKYFDKGHSTHEAIKKFPMLKKDSLYKYRTEWNKIQKEKPLAIASNAIKAHIKKSKEVNVNEKKTTTSIPAQKTKKQETKKTGTGAAEGRKVLAEIADMQFRDPFK